MNKTKLNRSQVINSEYLEEYDVEQVYNDDNENSITKHIFELKDILSYDILKQELIDSLEIDNKPLFLDANSRNIVRIFSENLENLQINDADDKSLLSTLREEIRGIVLDHLRENYLISYNINEGEEYIDLEPIADLYEFFIQRKLDNVFKYYYSIISMSFFDKIIENKEERKTMASAMREYLISINDKLTDGDVSDEEITMEILGDFFNNRFKIVNSGISNVIGMSSFLNYVLMNDEGEIVTDRIKEMFYNFGGFGGMEFDDTESFRNYFECLLELENSNELLVSLASKVFESTNG
jgi:hypothetical protein